MSAKPVNLASAPGISWVSVEWQLIAAHLGAMLDERKNNLCKSMSESETHGLRAEIRLLKKLLDWPNEGKTIEQEERFGL